MDHLLPLQVNPKTGEPFLRLRDHPNIILTPPRWEDAAELVRYYNDPKVYKWFSRLPYPYHRAHAEEWLRTIKPDQDRAFEELKANPNATTAVPVSFLREVMEDGREVFIGIAIILRSFHGEFMDTDTLDPSSKEYKEAINNALPPGDPSIRYSISGSHHGKGIMTDAIKTLLLDWAIPRMNVRKVLVGMFDNNVGSRRVFEKNGFKTTHLFKHAFEVRGEMRSLRVMGLDLDEAS